MKISVLITTRNRPEILKQCLKSLIRQSRRPDEIVVVDNSSSDNTNEIIKSFHGLKIKYFLEKNIGIAYGRNRGLKEAKGDIFAFIDDDCLATKNWLKEIEKTFKSDKNIVGIVGRNENMFPKNPYATAEQCWFLFWYLRHISSLERQERLTSGGLINFKNAAFRSSFLDSLKFDNRLSTGNYSEEDTEIRGRIFNKLKSKQCIIYLPEAKIYHRNRTSFCQLLIRKYFKGVSYFRLSLSKNIILIGDVSLNKNSSPFHLWAIAVSLNLRNIENITNKLICLYCIFLLPVIYKIGKAISSVEKLVTNIFKSNV